LFVFLLSNGKCGISVSKDTPKNTKKNTKKHNPFDQRKPLKSKKRCEFANKRPFEMRKDGHLAKTEA
jgi:hypothetical protein